MGQWIQQNILWLILGVTTACLCLVAWFVLNDHPSTVFIHDPVIIIEEGHMRPIDPDAGEGAEPKFDTLKEPTEPYRD